MAWSRSIFRSFAYFFNPYSKVFRKIEYEKSMKN